MNSDEPVQGKTATAGVYITEGIVQKGGINIPPASAMAIPPPPPAQKPQQAAPQNSTKSTGNGNSPSS